MVMPASGPVRQPPLWEQLQAVASVVQAVRSGTSATTALARVAPALKGGVQALAFHALRQLGRAQALRSQLVSRAAPAPVDALLCTALALAWNPDEAPYEAFTLVNQAVEAAKRQPSTRAQAGFLNACLRRFLRDRETLIAGTVGQPTAQWNHPVWWISRLRQDWPQDWESILVANNRHAPMTLRVNRRHMTPERYQLVLEDAGIPSTLDSQGAVMLAKGRAVQDLPGFLQGAVSVQDAAAQLAAPLLLDGLQSGPALRVLDACAAPGGKTAHLLELADCELTALDIDPQRCEKISQTLQRLGLSAQVRAADAAEVASWWDGQLFDAILLDAPCSASGIVRRHPDVRWLRRESDIDQLARMQDRLLSMLWPLVKAGGRLLFSTCSVFRAEGELRIKTFLAHNTDARLLPSPGHLLPRSVLNGRLLPENASGDHDGFFYALLEKCPA
jgi:16S rRNA (cytosine967-C5)-methyltransferase